MRAEPRGKSFAIVRVVRVRCIKEKGDVHCVCVGVLRDALKSVINVKMVGAKIKALLLHKQKLLTLSLFFPIARPLA